MIQSIKHKGLRRFFEQNSKKGIKPEYAERLNIMLTRLHGAAAAQDMGAPEYHLHPLKGGRKGQWAVTVAANWRIIFRFENGHAYDVDLVDYH